MRHGVLKGVWVVGLIMGWVTGVGMAGDFSEVVVHAKNRALMYVPDQIALHEPVRVLVALHGMQQGPQWICRALQSTADALNAVMVCPSANQFDTGFSRAPLDERQHVVALWQHIQQRAPFTPKSTVLLGFSRGGTYAVETGALFPDVFPHVVSLFGFYGQALPPILTATPPASYANASALLVTGKNDPTEPYQTTLATLLSQHGVATTLKVYPSLRHAIPSDIKAVLAAIYTRVESADDTPIDGGDAGERGRP